MRDFMKGFDYEAADKKKSCVWIAFFTEWDLSQNVELNPSISRTMRGRRLMFTTRDDLFISWGV